MVIFFFCNHRFQLLTLRIQCFLSSHSRIFSEVFHMGPAGLAQRCVFKEDLLPCCAHTEHGSVWTLGCFALLSSRTDQCCELNSWVCMKRPSLAQNAKLMLVWVILHSILPGVESALHMQAYFLFHPWLSFPSHCWCNFFFAPAQEQMVATSLSAGPSAQHLLSNLFIFLHSAHCLPSSHLLGD